MAKSKLLKTAPKSGKNSPTPATDFIERVLTPHDLIGLRQNDILTRAEVRVALGYPAKSELSSFSPEVPAPVTRHEITEMLMHVIGDGGPLLSPMQASIFANELNERFLILGSPAQQVSEVQAPPQTGSYAFDPSTWSWSQSSSIRNTVNSDGSGSSVFPADKEPETVPYYENFADKEPLNGWYVGNNLIIPTVESTPEKRNTGSVFPPTGITALEVANIINVALEITGYPYFKWALIADKLNERFGFSK